MMTLILILLSADKVVVPTVKEDPSPAQVKSLTTELSKGTIPLDSVYKVDRSDGGFVYASKVDGTTIYLDSSPCAWRPIGTVKSLCTKIDGGDPGFENTMQNGQWVGVGCVRKACVVVSGQPDK